MSFNIPFSYESLHGKHLRSRDTTISSLGSSCEIKVFKAFYFAINTKSIKLVSLFNSVYKHILFLTAKYGLLCASSV